MARACIVEAVEGVAIQKNCIAGWLDGRSVLQYTSCIAIGKGAGLGVHRRGRAAGAGVGAGACAGPADGRRARGQAGAGRAGARRAQGVRADAGRRRQALGAGGRRSRGRAQQSWARGALGLGVRGAERGPAGRAAWAPGLARAVHSVHSACFWPGSTRYFPESKYLDIVREPGS